MAQWVKDQLLSLGSMLWHGFNPWPGNFHMPWGEPKIKIPRGSHIFLLIQMEILALQNSGF